MRRPLIAGAATSALLLATLLAAPSASQSIAATPSETVPSAAGPFVTLLFSRTELTAAINCVPDDQGVARLDTVIAPYLASRGMIGTGTLETGRIADTETCTHHSGAIQVSWADATDLATRYGWRFVSHTATYPAHIDQLSPERSDAETCGSARTIDEHGLPGAHGMIAYPGSQPPPINLQTNYGAKCFAWGRQYGGNSTTNYSAATTSPYWQHTGAPNGGPCHDQTKACYNVKATGSTRYVLPDRFIARVRALTPGNWLTLQAYILVTGRSPATAPIKWDCTSSNNLLHWSNDNERYCLSDWMRIIDAVAAVPGVQVTDPLTVGVAFGRTVPTAVR